MSDVRRIRVVHLITLLELGGAQGNTIHTVKNLDAKLFDVHLWSGEGAYWDNAVKQSLADEGRLKFFSHLKRSIHPLFDVLVIFDLYRAFKKFKPDIVHTHSSKAGIVGRIAARWAKVPLIVHTFHGFGFHPYQIAPVRWLYILLEKWTAGMAHKLIFVSETNIQVARDFRIGHEGQYALIRSGVPLKAIKQQASTADAVTLKKSIGLAPTAQLVTTIGPFKPQKNLPDLIEAAAEFTKGTPDTHLLIIGDGSLRPQLEELIADRQLEQHVHLLGWRQDIAPWMAISTVFAMSSLWEGLPRALVEAMSLGIPAVCYDTDGVHDLLSRGGGVLVPQKNRVRLAEAITQLLTDEKLRSFLSEQAKGLVGDDFDIDEMVLRQAKLYLTFQSRFERDHASVDAN